MVANQLVERSHHTRSLLQPAILRDGQNAPLTRRLPPFGARDKNSGNFPAADDLTCIRHACQYSRECAYVKILLTYRIVARVLSKAESLTLPSYCHEHPLARSPKDFPPPRFWDFLPLDRRLSYLSSKEKSKVLNRANARLPIFEKDADYEAFERILELAVERTGTRLLSYCLMPNHWNLVVYLVHDGKLSKFTDWLTLTHTKRWHAHRHSTGQGHVYQGRFKSFPIQNDQHFINVCRYVERNALRANLVANARLAME